MLNVMLTAPNWKTACNTLKSWIVAPMKSTLDPFKGLASKFFRKRHYILNYHRKRISTAILQKASVTRSKG
jgi:transposase